MWLGIPKPMIPYPLWGLRVRGSGNCRITLGPHTNGSEVPDQKVVGLGL